MGGQENNAGCPLGLDVPAIAEAISKKDMKAAAEIISKNTPLPSICGRVCNAPCKGGSVNTDTLKAFVEARGDASPAKVDAGSKKVAVIGAGPAGLAAAHKLLQLGLKPTVFEAAQKSGGLLADVIPSFVLPREVLAADIANLEKMGVEIKTGSKVGGDVDWNTIEKDYDAVLVATGAAKGIIPDFPGIKVEGATDAVTFLRNVDNGRADIKGGVVVDGGSYASLQAARTAKKAGASSVTVVHQYPLENWSAGAEEIAAAKKEGIELMPDHKVTALWGIPVLDIVVAQPVLYARKDSRGRAGGIDLGRQVRIEAATFISAVFRQSLEFPPEGKYKKGVIGNLVVDDNYKLEAKGWYAAGEAATGAAGVVGSMATGQLAAEAIKKDVGGN